VQAGKVTVGLASHWPCVTDNSGITTYRLTALGRKPVEYDTLYVTLLDRKVSLANLQCGCSTGDRQSAV